MINNTDSSGQNPCYPLDIALSNQRRCIDIQYIFFFVVDSTLATVLERLAVAIERNNELLEQMAPQAASQPKIMPLSKAWQALGYKNYLQCYRKVKAGHYRVGHEVRDRRNPGASEPDYWLDIAACLERDKVLPARRKA